MSTSQISKQHVEQLFRASSDYSLGIAPHYASYFSSKACSGLADGIWELSWKGTKMGVRKEHTTGQLRCTKATKLTHSPRTVGNTVTRMIYKGNHGTDWMLRVVDAASSQGHWSSLLKPVEHRVKIWVQLKNKTLLKRASTENSRSQWKSVEYF
jgi:hypothetical protein